MPRRVLLRKRLKLAAGVGVVLAEPFVGELKMQTILIPAIF
jgi:hypothetical protein